MIGKIYERQAEFQEEVEGCQPTDDPKLFQYHITALQEEIGELLKSDKRWKTYRNTKYDSEEKLDEWADCFISILNIAMWSGFTLEQIMDSVDKKMSENFKRLRREK